MNAETQGEKTMETVAHSETREELAEPGIFHDLLRVRAEQGTFVLPALLRNEDGSIGLGWKRFLISEELRNDPQTMVRFLAARMTELP